MSQPRPGMPGKPKNPIMPGKPKKPPLMVDPRIKDDKVLRTMPITQSQLNKIKKHYGM